MALAGSCKNLAGKLKGIESERAALLQSVDMHRSENRRLLEVPAPPLPLPLHTHSLTRMLSTQESNLLKETLREAQGGDLGAIARAMSRMNKPQPAANKDKRLGLPWGMCCWHARGCLVGGGF